MDAVDQKVAEVLLAERLVTDAQLQSIVTQKQLLGGTLVELAIEMGYAQEGRVASALAARLDLPRLKLDELPPDAGALSLLDAVTCEQHTVFPVALRNQGRILWIAVSDPLDEKIGEVIRARTGVEQVKIGVAGPREIRRAVMQHFGKVTLLGRQAPRVSAAARDQDDDAAPFSPLAEEVDKTILSSMEAIEAQRTETRPMEPAAAPPPNGQLQEILTMLQQLVVSHERLTQKLQSLADLCVDKGLFTAEEWKRRQRR